jgi:diacylglycerol O-acyltransferase / wax synthase
MARYDRLPPMDSSFLYAESPSAHMHVGSLGIFRDPKISDEALLAHVESRLHLVPRYRQKIAWVPGNQGRPVWVDDPHFDVRNHVLFTGIPSTDSERDILKLTSRLLSRPLDRARPLWEMWHVQLRDGRIAIITKSHHCLVDGISAVDIGTALMDFGPETTRMESPPWVPEKEPTRGELLRDALVERATQPREMMRSLRAATRAPRELLEKSKELAQGIVSFGKAGLELAPRTSFTKSIGPHRRFEIVRTDLSRIKAVRARFQCTVNDVVLATVAGAMRRLMLSRGESVAGVALRTMVPVSFRTESERNTYGNKVSWVVADLPVGEENPEERVRRVHDSMAYLKQSKQAIGADFWFKMSEYAPPTVLALAGRAVAFQRMSNLIVTNIPGPQMPLYFQGAEMLEAFPVVPIAGVTSLGIAVLSYNGKVNFGLNADFSLFPDLEVLAKAITESLDELHDLAGVVVPSRRQTGLAPIAS